VPGVAAGSVGPAWDSTESGHLLSGGGHRGRPGYAAASRVGRSGAAARRQVRTPVQARTGNPPSRLRELADARTTNGHEHQGNEGKRQNPEER
jgi:hypothetical protein